MNVSVIIPTHNRRALLKRAMLSVYAQTRLPDEVIVIDDGSTDGTEQMVRSEFPEVIYRYQKNAGVSSARNLGIRMASSEWLAFLDSDDEWRPSKLERQQLELDNAQMKICHTEEIWIRNGHRVNPMKKHAKKGGWIFQHCLPLCAISPSSILIHSTVLDEVGMFDESLPACEDYDLWLRITARYPISFIEEPMIIKHGGHEDQLSRQYWGMDRFRIQALEKMLSGDCLTDENRTKAVEMMLYKASIYLQGAKKRGKENETGYYEKLISRHANSI